MQKILDWPVPKTVKELSSFLGFTGYYCSFILKYAYLTREINAQMKKKELEWTEDMNMKFEILKGLFEKKTNKVIPMVWGG